MSPAWFGCADRARQRDDPMIGSAPHALGWLLIEHPGPWGVEAPAGSGLDEDVLRSLSRAARGAGWRILLVRRPGRRANPQERRWIAVGAGDTRVGRWLADAELRAAAEAVRTLSAKPALPRPPRGAEPAAAPAAPAPPAAPAADDPADRRSAEPIILVCTHGTHDTCCAVRGRPVAEALAARWPDAVWECSHLGGDRFAANAIVLPDAAYYGNLDADSAVRTVGDHLNGRLDLDRLRGLARFPPVAQVAIAEAHRRLGPLPADAVSAATPEQLLPHRWLVAVTAPAGTWHATVVAERREPAVLTCRAAAATPATAYRVMAFDPA